MPRTTIRGQRTRTLAFVALTTLVAIMCLAQPAGATTQVVADTFTRTTTSGWGTAPTGGAYSQSAPTGRTFVNGWGGALEATAAGSLINLLPAARTRDITTESTFEISKKPLGGNIMVSLYARATGTTDAAAAFRARVIIEPSGGATVYLQRWAGSAAGASSSLVLGTVGLPFRIEPGTTYRFRLTAIGSTPTRLSATVWPSGAAEPAAPTLTGEDNYGPLWAPGLTGAALYAAPAITNYPIRATFTDLNAWDTSAVQWRSGFEAAPWTSEFSPTSPPVNDPAIINGAPAFAGKSLAVRYPKGSYSSPNFTMAQIGGTKWYTPLDSSGIGIGQYDTLHLRYRIRFQPGFQFAKAGKLPGLAGGTANGGGNIPNGSDGWSGRLLWAAGGRVETYMYLPTSVTWGTEFLWNYGGVQRYFQPGTWHCVEMAYHVNTPGSPDGYVIGWFDGQKALEKTGLTYRSVYTLHIDQLFFDTFFGGNTADYASPQEQYSYFDDFAIGPKYIGC